jgi:hypothetical protein
LLKVEKYGPLASPMNPIAEVFVAILVGLLRWIFGTLLIIPLLWILLTPVILVFALFQTGAYWSNVSSGYKGIARGVGSVGGALL